MKMGNQYSEIEVASALCPKCDGTDGYPNLRHKYALLCRQCDSVMMVKGKVRLKFMGWIIALFIFSSFMGAFLWVFAAIGQGLFLFLTTSHCRKFLQYVPIFTCRLNIENHGSGLLVVRNSIRNFQISSLTFLDTRQHLCWHSTPTLSHSLFR